MSYTYANKNEGSLQVFPKKNSREKTSQTVKKVLLLKFCGLLRSYFLSNVIIKLQCNSVTTKSGDTVVCHAA